MDRKMIAKELLGMAKELMAADSTLFYRTKGGTKRSADSMRDVPDDAAMVWNRTETFVGRLLNNGEWQLQTFAGNDPTVVQDFKDRFEVRYHVEGSDRMASSKVAMNPGLALSCNIDWDFGVLYHKASIPFEGKGLSVLSGAMELGKDELEAAFRRIARRYPTQGVYLTEDVVVNHLDRNELVLQLRFDKNEGAEILLS